MALIDYAHVSTRDQATVAQPSAALDYMREGDRLSLVTSGAARFRLYHFTRKPAVPLTA
jgi:hypothetical protein